MTADGRMSASVELLLLLVVVMQESRVRMRGVQ